MTLCPSWLSLLLTFQWLINQEVVNWYQFVRLPDFCMIFSSTTLIQYWVSCPECDFRGRWLPCEYGLLSFFLFFYLFEQWLCVPFVLMSPFSADITKTALNSTYQAPWIGSVDNENAAKWIDNFLLLVRTVFSNFVSVSGPILSPVLSHVLIWKVSVIYRIHAWNSHFGLHDGHNWQQMAKDKHAQVYTESVVLSCFSSGSW